MSININLNELIQRTNIALLQNNLNTTTKKIKTALTDFINQAIEHFRKNPPLPPIEEIEKRAITHVITIVRLKDQQQNDSSKMGMQQMQQMQQHPKQLLLWVVQLMLQVQQRHKQLLL